MLDETKRGAGRILWSHVQTVNNNGLQLHPFLQGILVICDISRAGTAVELGMKGEVIA
ncbi:hypothetical protein D3C72_2300310 [compost metagenome]